MVYGQTETGSEDDGLLDLSDDDFFDKGSSSDEADADDELTDKSTKYGLVNCGIVSLDVNTIQWSLPSFYTRFTCYSISDYYLSQFLREAASSASGRATSGMSSDERNQVRWIFLIFSNGLKSETSWTLYGVTCKDEWDSWMVISLFTKELVSMTNSDLKIWMLWNFAEAKLC